MSTKVWIEPTMIQPHMGLSVNQFATTSGHARMKPMTRQYDLSAPKTVAAARSASGSFAIFQSATSKN